MVIRAYHQLLGLYTDVNRQLSARCESVPAAAQLWTRTARAAGYTPATLALWKAVNGHTPLPGDLTPRNLALSPLFSRAYTLYQQPASQQTGRCAHVLVVNASGISSVYVARIQP
jgi:hypothetical protein